MKFDPYRETASRYASRNTRTTITAVVFFWSASISAYPEPFLFFRHPFSVLGACRTPSGLSNTGPAMIWFLLSMLVTAYLMRSARVFYRREKPANSTIFQTLLGIGVLGALIACIPSDLSKPLHSLGSGLLVFSRIGIVMTRIQAQKGAIPGSVLRIRIYVLMIPMVLYAIAWAVWLEELVQWLQKTALVSLFGVEWHCSREAYISREAELFQRGLNEPAREWDVQQ